MEAHGHGRSGAPPIGMDGTTRTEESQVSRDDTWTQENVVIEPGSVKVRKLCETIIYRLTDK